MNTATTPPIYHDRERQLRGMIIFHRRAQKAFEAVGKIADAEDAKRMADELQKELDELVEQRR